MSSALLISCLFMLPSLAAAVLLEEFAVINAFTAACIFSFFFGLACRKLGGEINAQVQPRIYFMTTIFTWVMLILISSGIYMLGIKSCSPVDAIVESVAGWTTTGTGIYDLAALSPALRLWRSTTNWLGGIGIIMLTLSLLPSRRYIGWSLAATEFPGPDFLKSETGFRNIYRKIFIIYAALTVMQFILLASFGMNVFDALLSALSNSSTAGLRHINNGDIRLESLPIKTIITIFALMSSINISFFVYIKREKLHGIRKSAEFRFYVWRILITGLALAVIIIAANPNRQFLRVFGESLMQLLSFVSTAGYFTTDVRLWPAACVIIVLLQMFFGACSLSTGGGIKNARIIIALKTTAASIYRNIHPNSVRTIKYDRKEMKSEWVARANLFIALFMITFLVGALLLSLDNMSLYDALNYSQAMITNTGTSIGLPTVAGISQDYSWFTKLVMSALMLAGRLEIYPLLMLFFRSFWKSDSSF